MEQINQENFELRSRLQQVEAEAKRLKDVEDSLFRTLKTAEDTGASIITEASEAADQIIGEANQIAENTTKQAHIYAEQVKKQADEHARVITAAAEAKAKDTIKEIRESMQSLVRSYDGLLEQREAIVKSLKRLSQDALNQIELSDAHFFRIDAKAYQRAIDELSRSNHFSVANVNSLASTVPTQVPPIEEEPESLTNLIILSLAGPYRREEVTLILVPLIKCTRSTCDIPNLVCGNGALRRRPVTPARNQTHTTCACIGNQCCHFIL